MAPAPLRQQRDARLADALVELAETRAIARALRFSGVGSSSRVPRRSAMWQTLKPEPEQTTGKEAKPVFTEETQGSKPETKSPGNGNGQVTQAQCRALFALTKRANYSAEDVESLLHPLNATTFQDLTREDASRLIQSLQTAIAA